MKNNILVLACLSLVACLSNPSKEDGFYTWVDERGQIHTVQTPVSHVDKRTRNGPDTEKGDLDSSEFETEEQVQARLRDSKMFAWQENGQQTIVETPQNDSVPPLQKPSLKLAGSSSGSYASFRKGEYVSWQEIVGKEVSLEQLFSYNDVLERDFILIDLEGVLVSSEISLKSYIEKSTITVPQMVFLSGEFTSVSEDIIPFEYYFSESWHSYGYMSGSLIVPRAAQYLLIYTSTLTEALQLDGQVIKLTNLGKISFELSN
mgnify:CR=1 FL=1